MPLQARKRLSAHEWKDAIDPRGRVLHMEAVLRAVRRGVSEKGGGEWHFQPVLASVLFLTPTFFYPPSSFPLSLTPVFQTCLVPSHPHSYPSTSPSIRPRLAPSPLLAPSLHSSSFIPTFPPVPLSLPLPLPSPSSLFPSSLQGCEPRTRPEVWEFLLGMYPPDSSFEERAELKRLRR